VAVSSCCTVFDACIVYSVGRRGKFHESTPRRPACYDGSSVILTTQAHYDHVGAHARLKKVSGGRVLVSTADAPIVEGGGEGDYLFGAEFHYPPTKVDATVRDGEVVKVVRSL
jgi:hypothetical protein